MGRDLGGAQSTPHPSFFVTFFPLSPFLHLSLLPLSVLFPTSPLLSHPLPILPFSSFPFTTLTSLALPSHPCPSLCSFPFPFFFPSFPITSFAPSSSSFSPFLSHPPSLYVCLCACQRGQGCLQNIKGKVQGPQKGGAKAELRIRAAGWQRGVQCLELDPRGRQSLLSAPEVLWGCPSDPQDCGVGLTAVGTWHGAHGCRIGFSSLYPHHRST